MTLPDSDTLANYLAADQLVDFSPMVDPNTDLPAEGANEAFASLAMMTRMAPRAYVVLVPGDGSVELTEHDAVWGNTYLVAPTVEYINTGRYVVTFPASVNDALGVEHSVNLRRAKAFHVEDSGNVWFITGEVLTANTVAIYVKDFGGDYTDALGKDVFFEVL